ncbi:MAG TPA: hypothetical protein VF291_11295 [Burkholderiaceae bacterium]
MGASLFERSTRRVRLTAAGEAFAAECRLALGRYSRSSTVRGCLRRKSRTSGGSRPLIAKSM